MSRIVRHGQQVGQVPSQLNQRRHWPIVSQKETPVVFGASRNTGQSPGAAVCTSEPILLLDRPKPMRRPIFQGLLTVAVLGVVTSSLAVVALHRTVTGIQSLRLSHARESTAEELGRLASSPPGADLFAPNIIGMRGDIARLPAEIAARVPSAWGAQLVALAEHALASQGPVYADVAVPEGRLVERARRRRPGAASRGSRSAWGNRRTSRAGACWWSRSRSRRCCSSRAPSCRS